LVVESELNHFLFLGSIYIDIGSITTLAPLLMGENTYCRGEGLIYFKPFQRLSAGRAFLISTNKLIETKKAIL
jgi:hypothetical protein